jgi:molecular chaperone GrpE (heat shock protein)
MKYLSDEINNRIISIVEKNFNVVLVSNVERFSEFFNSLLEQREAFPDYDENAMILNTENAQKICDNINSQIDTHFQKNDNLGFEKLFPELVDQIDNILLQLEPVIQVEQNEARFKLLDNDKKFIGVGKRIKILVFTIQQILKKIINPVLKLLRQNPLNNKYWNQKIPLRNVAFEYLRNRLLKKLSDVYEDVFRELSEKSILFWNYDESYDEEYISNFIAGNKSTKIKSPAINPETIISDLEKLKEAITKKSLEAIEDCAAEFDDNCQKVGTIELSKSEFNSRKISKELNSEKNEFTKCIQEWDNTLFALGEDWELNYDLESTRYSAIDVYYKFTKSLSVKNKIKIYPQFKEISGTLNFVIDKLNQPAENIQGIERLIILSREPLQRVLLSSLLPNLINSISDIRLEGMINEARRTIKNQIRSLAEKRAFVKTATYNEKIKSSEIDEIYPREFISFNTLPKFLASLEKIKDNISIE